MLRQQPFPHMEYYRYLNGGYRLPLAGGTDKMSADVPVGLYRTYVRLPEGESFDYDAWCRNMAAGRTYLSGGPLLELSVDGLDIGDTLRLPEGGGTVTVRACAESILPIHSLQIVQAGEVVAETRDVAGARRLDLTADVHVTEDSWIAARTGGPNYFDAPEHHDGWHRKRFGHTSPVYVTTGEGDWSMWSDETARYMLTLIDGSVQYIRQRSTQYPAGHAVHHHGHDDHQAYLEETLPPGPPSHPPTHARPRNSALAARLVDQAGAIRLSPMQGERRTKGLGLRLAELHPVQLPHLLHGGVRQRLARSRHVQIHLVRTHHPGHHRGHRLVR